jgi:pimeloyl-ACP methyl ester carboxylesterase
VLLLSPKVCFPAGIWAVSTRAVSRFRVAWAFLGDRESMSAKRSFIGAYGRRAAGLLFVLLLVGGCAGLFVSRHEKAAWLAAEQGWQKHILSAGRFDLTGFSKGFAGASRELTVYIESDGYSWVTKNRPSPDPTPIDPIALRLALRDPAPKILYLARPCQYARSYPARGCQLSYWTTHRFAPEVVEGINQAIDRAKRLAAAERITLVGYSGGGGLVLLLAAARHDVSRLITVAGVLDHPAWTAYHGVSPLRGSLNPADAATVLGAVPQIHFVGGDDKTVPPLIAAAYRRRLAEGNRARVIVVPEFDHECCWEERWPELLTR